MSLDTKFNDAKEALLLALSFNTSLAIVKHYRSSCIFKHALKKTNLLITKDVLRLLIFKVLII